MTVANAGLAQSAVPVSTSPVYLQAGPVVTVHFEGTQYHRASPPLKGASFGGSLVLGARVAPAAAFEAELVLDGAVSSPQTDIYTSRVDYTAESRDTIVGLNLRLSQPRAPRLEFVAGAGLARSRFARRDVSTTDLFFGRGVTRGPDRETTTWQPTAHGALAVRVPLSPRVDLVPAVGARWIQREFDTDAWYLGVGRYMVFFSAAIRLKP